MRNLSATIARLAALRGLAGVEPPGGEGGGLEELARFGSNPGALRGWFYLPDGLADGAPLVVVLHGCTQGAAGYDAGAGWSRLADRHGFALLFPEQQRANNPNLCFDWFNPEDSRRDQGEVLSIREMIGAMVERHGLDPDRLFVTGLSAGGAMAVAMLATYPELFAGGAIIAGLPYGCATTVPQAFDRMRGHGMPDEAALTALVRNASLHEGRWPILSIWQGGADTTVSPSNAEALIGQWRPLHGAAAVPSTIEAIGPHSRRVWRDAAGRAVIEAYAIAGMGHGTPLDTIGPDGCGASGPYMLEAGISSTRLICRFWGLDGNAAAAGQGQGATPAALAPIPPVIRVPAALAPVVPVAAARAGAASGEDAPAPAPAPAGVARIIEDALRSAGLMR